MWKSNNVNIGITSSAIRKFLARSRRLASSMILLRGLIFGKS